MTQKRFRTDDELKSAIDAYFAKLVADETPPTITGLALALGFESRQSFYDYEKNGEHSYTIKRARMFIESAYEARLHGTSPTGAIFALKNFGWKDSQEITGQDGAPLIPSAITITLVGSNGADG